MHILIDKAITPQLVNAINVEWPAADWPHWHIYRDGNALKRCTKDAERLPPAAKLAINKLCELSHSILPADCFPDLNLYGAGLHELPDGGFLRKHLDTSSHPIHSNWERVASGILYLNDTFQGGALKLEDSNHVDGAHTFWPKPGRLVVFRTTEDAYHWVEQVTGGTRRSLALFWWRITDNPNKARVQASYAE